MAAKRRSDTLSLATIERLVYLAGRAPSPDNNQPWRFKSAGNNLQLYYAQERALLSDASHAFDYLSLGAAIENIRIAAAFEGYRLGINYFPSASDATHVADLCLSPLSEETRTDLYHHLARRKTVRALFRKREVDAKCLKDIERIASEMSLSLAIAMDLKEIKRLANAVATCDTIRFQYKSFHVELFRMLRFSKSAAEQKRDGIHVKALAALPGTGLFLRLVSCWPVARVLSHLGMTKAIYVASYLQAYFSGAIGAIAVNSSDPSSLVKAGEAMQRIWLTLEKNGVSVQPLGSLPAMSLLADDPSSPLKDGDRARIAEARKNAWLALRLEAGSPVLLFRMGYAKRPLGEVSYRYRTELNLDADAIQEEPKQFDYDLAFSRNIGLTTVDEQAQLKQTTVAIAGLGGVGGAHAMTLARLGLGGFHLADFDTFEVANLNRQFGALISTLGCLKSDVMSSFVRDVNPEARVKSWKEPLAADNIEEFLSGTDVVLDGIDAYCIDTRRHLFMAARKMGIPVITAGPIGYSCAMLVFTPSSMSFDTYFSYNEADPPREKFIKFIVGLTPSPYFVSYMQVGKVDLDAATSPSLSSAVSLCAGFAATELIRIVLDKGKIAPVPHYHYFDPYLMRFKRGYVPFGNRHIFQRMKMAYVRSKLPEGKKATA